MAGLGSLRRSGPGRALSVRNFRVYFFGVIVSVNGTWMQTTAQSWLVLQLTESPLALATVVALQTLPILFLSLVGGAISDRYSARRVLLVTQSIAALQAIALGTLTLTGQIAVWHIYVLGGLLGLLSALDIPARQALVSSLAPRELLHNSIALVSMAQNVGRIVGPAVAGILIGFVGVEAAFYANAATFGGMVAALLLINPATMAAAAQMPALAEGMGRQIGAAFAYMRRRPSMLFLLIATAFIGLFGQNFTTTVPLVAEYLVHASPAQFGILNSCLGVGSLTGALVLSFRSAPGVSRIVVTGFLFGLALIAVSFSRHLWLSGLLFVVVGLVFSTFTTSITTSVLLQAPAHMRGRFASIFSMFSLGLMPIGQFMTGAVASGFAVETAVFFNGAMCFAGIAIALTYFLRTRTAGVRFDLTGALEASPAEPREPADTSAGSSMVEREWAKIIPADDLAAYQRIPSSLPLPGDHTCLIVVDVTHGSTGSRGLTIEQAMAESPGACGPSAWEAMPRIARLVRLFRERDLPVIFTRMNADEPWHISAIGQSAGSVSNEFPPEIAPTEGEWVLEKTKASAFFQTPVTSHLIRHRVDTLVICGASTSGCVRATAVDASSHGFRTFVVDDCSFDRSWFAHCASLFDINARYARVLPLDELDAILPPLQRKAAE